MKVEIKTNEIWNKEVFRTKVNKFKGLQGKQVKSREHLV